MRNIVLTIAAAMFILVLLTMLACAIPADVRGKLLFYGGWSMTFILIVAAKRIFIGTAERESRN